MLIKNQFKLIDDPSTPNEILAYDLKTKNLHKTPKPFKIENLPKATHSLKKQNSNEVKVVINICNTCNLKCKYCFAHGGNYGRPSKKELMTNVTALKIIHDLKKSKIEISKILFFGGEPFLNLEVIETFCKNLTSKKIQFYVVTNGTIFTNDILSLIKKYNIKTTVSLDFDDDINDKFRGKDTATMAKGFIKNLQQEVPHENICIQSVFTPDSFYSGYNHKMIREQFEKLYPGIWVNITDVRPNNKSDTDFQFKNGYQTTQNKAHLEQVKSSLETNDIIWPLSTFAIIKKFIEKKDNIHFCDEIENNKTITYDYDGTAKKCQMFWGKELGDLKNENDKLTEINKKENYSQCRQCWMKDYCTLCPATFNLLPSQQKISSQFHSCEILEEEIILTFQYLARIASSQESLNTFIEKYQKVGKHYTNNYFA